MSNISDEDIDVGEYGAEYPLQISPQDQQLVAQTYQVTGGSQAQDILNISIEKHKGQVPRQMTEDPATQHGLPQKIQLSQLFKETKDHDEAGASNSISKDGSSNRPSQSDQRADYDYQETRGRNQQESLLNQNNPIRRGNGYDQTFQRIAMGQGSLAHTSKTIGQLGSSGQNSRSRKAKSQNAGRWSKLAGRAGPGVGESSGTEEDGGGGGERGQSKGSSTSERARYWNRIAGRQREAGEQVQGDYVKNPRLVVRGKNSNSMLQLGVNHRPNRIVDAGTYDQRPQWRRDPSLSERQLEHEDIRVGGDERTAGQREVNIMKEQNRAEEFDETQRKGRNQSRQRLKISNSATQTLKSQCSRCSAHSVEMNALND